MFFFWQVFLCSCKQSLKRQTGNTCEKFSQRNSVNIRYSVAFMESSDHKSVYVCVYMYMIIYIDRYKTHGAYMHGF